MSNPATKLLCLFLLSISLGSMTSQAQTPAPAAQTQFSLPLADKTTAVAVILPTLNEQAFLVYATPSGKIGLYLLSLTTPSPTPPVPPIPPIPPTPIPQKLTIAIVEDPAATTHQQRAVLTDPLWRNLAAEKHDFRGIIPADIIEKGTGKPPASLVPFLDRAKLHNLPWIMFTTATGTIIWEGQLPTTAQELAAIIRQHGG